MLLIKKGEKFNLLTVIKEVESKKNRQGRNVRHVLCKCECGSDTVIPLTALRTGNTKSCGCWKMKVLINRSTKHGLGRHPLRATWMAMKSRCCSVNNPRFADYGGRGITVCEQWRNDFMSYYNWCINNGWKKGLSVDRIDNNGGYSPENCRIVTIAENNNNRRNMKLITYKGKTQNITTWAKELGLSYSMVYTRLNRYNPTPEELFEKKNRYYKHKDIADKLQP